MAVAYDCAPTLSDTQVLEFCKKGFLVLKGVVPECINRKTVEFLNQHASIEPTGILGEAWFVDNVIKNPAAAGAVRSLLGRDLGLPILVSNHRVVCPQPAQEWHVDSDSRFGPPLDYLQVFYYPEGMPEGDGANRGPTGVPSFLYAPDPYGQLRQDSGGRTRIRAGWDHIYHDILDLASAQRFHR